MDNKARDIRLSESLAFKVPHKSEENKITP